MAKMWVEVYRTRGFDIVADDITVDGRRVTIRTSGSWWLWGPYISPPIGNSFDEPRIAKVGLSVADPAGMTILRLKISGEGPPDGYAVETSDFDFVNLTWDGGEYYPHQAIPLNRWFSIDASDRHIGDPFDVAAQFLCPLDWEVYGDILQLTAVAEITNTYEEGEPYIPPGGSDPGDTRPLPYNPRIIEMTQLSTYDATVVVDPGIDSSAFPAEGDAVAGSGSTPGFVQVTFDRGRKPTDFRTTPGPGAGFFSPSGG